MSNGVPFTFFAEGTPFPQPRGIPNWAMHTITESGKVKPWKREVSRGLNYFKVPTGVPRGALRVSGCFYVRRPKSHYTLKGTLKASAPKYPISKRVGDLDNLIKPVWDVMTRYGIWGDDSWICGVDMDKLYAEPLEMTGVQVTVESFKPRYARGG